MNINDAVALRIEELLKEKNLKKSVLRKKSGILHGSLECILRGRNKTVTLTTIYMLARGFEISILEFLNSPFLLNENILIDG